MFIVGLTGGIATGKSTAALMLANLGAMIIDADAIARELVASQDLKMAILAHFGPAVLDEHQYLNRAKLRDIIFANDQQRAWLEQLLHPLIYAELDARIAKATTFYCVVVIPLLFECAIGRQFDRILVIDAPEALQIQRAQKRDNISSAQVTAILRTQLTREARIAKADDVICNNQGFLQLYQQICRLHKQYSQHLGLLV